MLRSFLLLSLLFIPALLRSQNSMKRSELSSDYFLTGVDANGAVLSAKYSGISIAVHKKTKEMILYGEADAGTIIMLERVKYGFSFYPENFTGCTYSAGKVRLCSTVPGKATNSCGIFDWGGESLVYEREESTDLSAMQTDRARKLLEAGDVAAAIPVFDSVAFYKSYYDAEEIAVRLLLASEKQGAGMVERRRFKDAVTLTSNVMNFKGWEFLEAMKTEAELKAKIGKNLFGLTHSKMQAIVEGWAAYANEARMYDEALRIAASYFKFFPESTGFLLVQADAWYGKKDKIKSKELYIKYIEKMKLLKKEKEIPYTVQQRAAG